MNKKWYKVLNFVGALLALYVIFGPPITVFWCVFGGVLLITNLLLLMV